jgi:hypothetical protein
MESQSEKNSTVSSMVGTTYLNWSPDSILYDSSSSKIEFRCHRFNFRWQHCHLDSILDGETAI